MHISPCRNAYFSWSYTETPLQKKEQNVFVSGSNVFHSIAAAHSYRRLGRPRCQDSLFNQPSIPRPSQPCHIQCSVGRIATFHHSMKSIIVASALLPAERAALGKTGLATGGLAEDLGAAGADDDSLGVREDSGDGEAAGALDVHEEGAGTGHKGLSGVYVRGCDSGWRFGGGGVCVYLELVLAGLVLRARVEKVDGENLQRRVSGRCPSRWYSCPGEWAGGRWRCCAESAVVCWPMSSLPPPPNMLPARVCDVPCWRLPDFNW